MNITRRALLAGILSVSLFGLAACGTPDPLTLEIDLEPGQLASLREQADNLRATRTAVHDLIAAAFESADRGDSDLDEAAINLFTHHVSGWLGASVGRFPPNDGYEGTLSAESEANSIALTLNLDGASFQLTVNG